MNVLNFTIVFHHRLYTPLQPMSCIWDHIVIMFKLAASARTQIRLRPLEPTTGHDPNCSGARERKTVHTRIRMIGTRLVIMLRGARLYAACIGVYACVDKLICVCVCTL